jgi:hypothetical protein
MKNEILRLCQVPGEKRDAAGKPVFVAPCRPGEKVSLPGELVVCSAEARRTCADLKQMLANRRENGYITQKKKRGRVFQGKINREG